MLYRLLFFDRHHHLLSRFEFRAPNDFEAEAAARDVANTGEVRELWSGEVLVASWQTQPERPTDTD